jgi:hypothetical protein
MSIDSLEAIASGDAAAGPVELAKQILVEKNAERRQAERQKRKAKASKSKFRAIGSKPPDWWREQT